MKLWISNKKQAGDNPLEIQELLKKFAQAAEHLDSMVRTHAEGLKILKEMRKLTANIGKYQSRDALESKTQIKGCKA